MPTDWDPEVETDYAQDYEYLESHREALPLDPELDEVDE